MCPWSLVHKMAHLLPVKFLYGLLLSICCGNRIHSFLHFTEGARFLRRALSFAQTLLSTLNPRRLCKHRRETLFIHGNETALSYNLSPEEENPPPFFHHRLFLALTR